MKTLKLSFLASALASRHYHQSVAAGGYGLVVSAKTQSALFGVNPGGRL